MGTVTKQANFTLPEDLLEELKKTVPKGEQSKVVGEALRNELKRIKFKKALEASFGAWKSENHHELAKGARSFVRSLRKSAMSRLNNPIRAMPARNPPLRWGLRGALLRHGGLCERMG